MTKNTKTWTLILLNVVLILSLMWMQGFSGGQAHQLITDKSEAAAASQGSSVGNSVAEGVNLRIPSADHPDVVVGSLRTGVANSEEVDQLPEHSPRVFGTVTLAGNGEPVNGAWVRILVGDNVLESETGPRGHFEISLKDYAGEAGQFQIIAGVEGAYSDRRPEDWIEYSPASQEIGPFQLELVAAHLLEVHVRDGATKQPMIGARVFLSNFAETTTDDLGMAQIFLPRFANLNVEAEGYQRVIRRLCSQGRGPSQLTIDLNRGIRVTGTIHDHEGNPIGDMRIHGSVGLVMSEPDGSFDLGLLGEGNHHLSGHKQGYSTINIQYAIDLIKDQPQKVLHLTTRKLVSDDAIRFTGICVDRDGEPLVGVEVCARSMGVDSATVTSDELGRFELETLGKNFTILWAYKPGFAKYTRFLSINGEDEMDVRVVLGQAHRLIGRVVNREGEPLARVKWRLEPRVHVGGHPKTQGITDQEGRFRIVGVDGKYSAVFSHSGYQESRTLYPLLNDDDAEIVLQPIAFFRGKVLEEKGEAPVTSFTVVVVGEDKRAAQHFLSGDGAFEKPARYLGQVASVRVVAEGFQTQTHELTAKELEGEGHPQIFKLKRANLKVAGVVLDSQQRPWPGVQINLMGSEDSEKLSDEYLRFNHGLSTDSLGLRVWGNVTSDAQGKFRFEGVSLEAALGLLVKGPGVATELTLGLEKYSDEQLRNVRITAQEAAVIQGKVSAREYPEALGVFLVGTSQQKPMSQRRVLNPDRTYSFDSLPPGQYRLSMTDSGFRHLYKVRKRVDIVAEEVATVNFGEEDGFKLSGRALMAGRALANGVIYLVKEGAASRDWRITQTDDGGLFQFEGVAPGSYVAIAFRRDYGEAGMSHNHANRVAITQEDADLFREFTFREFGSVRGRYSDEANVSFLLRGRTDEGLISVRRSQVQKGLFEFPEVAPGRYTLVSQLYDGEQREMRTLVTEVLMPEDGSDVDLGEVGSGK